MSSNQRPPPIDTTAVINEANEEESIEIMNDTSSISEGDRYNNNNNNNNNEQHPMDCNNSNNNNNNNNNDMIASYERTPIAGSCSHSQSPNSNYLAERIASLSGGSSGGFVRHTNHHYPGDGDDINAEVRGEWVNQLPFAGALDLPLVSGGTSSGSPTAALRAAGINPTTTATTAGTTISNDENNNNNNGIGDEGEDEVGVRLSNLNREYRMSGLSASEGDSVVSAIDEEENEEDADSKEAAAAIPASPPDPSPPASPTTPKSTLNLVSSSAGGSSSSGMMMMMMNGQKASSAISIMTTDSSEFEEQLGQGQISNIQQQQQQQQQQQINQSIDEGDSSREENSATTSQAVRMADDVTETSFTTMTTVGDMNANESNAVVDNIDAVRGVATGAATASAASTGAGAGNGVPPATAPTSGGSGVAFAGTGTVIAAGGNLIDKQRFIQQMIHPPPRESNPSPSAAAAGAAGATSTSTSSSIPMVRSRQRNKLRSARSPRPPRRMRAVDWCPPSSMGSSSSSSSALGASANNANANVAGVASASAAGSARGSLVSSGMASDKTAVTSRAVRMGDDATVTTFATMTTMGDAGSILEADTEEEEESSSSSSSGGGESAEGDVEEDLERDDEEDDDDEEEEEDGQGALVDKIPSFASGNVAGTMSVASGTTNHAVRLSGGDCDRSITSYATMNTFGDLGSIYESEYFKEKQVRYDGDEEEEVEEDGDANDAGDTVDSRDVMVDKVPSSTSTPGTSVVSGATNQAVRMGDDRSIVSFATMTTMGDMINTYDNTMTSQTPMPQSLLPPRSDTRAVVDRTPSNTAEAGESVVSGTTNHSVRMGDEASIATFATMTTAGGRDRFNNPGTGGGVVDKVPNYPPMSATSVATATTNHAIKNSDDQSVATWATMATSGMTNHANEHVVDKTPSFNEKTEAQSVSGMTNRAIKQEDDQSVVTWNTMTTAGGAKLATYAVDRVPSYSNKGSFSASGNDTTNAVRGDDQSVVTFATMTTFGGNLGNAGDNMVDKVPSFAEAEETSNAGKTTDTVVMGDNQSIATWTTMNTMGGQMIGNVVDKVPSSAREAGSSIMSLPTTNAVADERSMATFATTATSRERGIQEVVDNVPTFAGGAGASVISGVTGQAVRISDDRSVASLATMTTVGDLGSIYERETYDGAANFRRRGGRGSFSEENVVVDRIPTFAGGDGTSIISGRTDNAVRTGDDITVTTFATMTTAGEMTNMSVYEEEEEEDSPSEKASGEDNDSTPQRKVVSKTVDALPPSSATVASGTTTDAVRIGDDLTVTTFATMTTVGDGAGVGVEEDDEDDEEDEEDEEVDIASGSVSSSSRLMPSAGILRESRHNRVSALRETRGFRSPTSSAFGSSAPPVAPINAGESVSNTHILRAITDLRFHVDYRIGELREMNRRDNDRVMQMVQQEQQKRTALEARLHSQLLLQSESMVAMELKLLRLEARVAHRESHRQRRQPGIGGMAITDRLPPIAATPSSPNRIDEEVDSFEELELTPRAARHSAGTGPISHSGSNRGGPTNIAVVTRSGASVASAVTATSFPDVDFGSHLHDMNDDGRSDGSEDGDVEDEGEEHNDGDGSHSTPTQESNNRISNLESILLNPISAGGNNDQGISTRATRGDTDGMSSLPTSVTSTTMASTVVTSTTRGESIGVLRSSSRASEEDALPENNGVEDDAASGNNAVDGRIPTASRPRNIRTNSDDMLDMSAEGAQPDRPRSRSQSPLTVQSAATASVGPQSVASASLGASILSSAAVAPSRAFGTRRVNAAIAAAMNNAEGRPLANRVVSFTTHDLVEEQMAPPQENDGGGDSITMPDELDNFSDIADAFSNSARVWREEYEARLDAINKRLGN